MRAFHSLMFSVLLLDEPSNDIDICDAYITGKIINDWKHILCFYFHTMKR